MTNRTGRLLLLLSLIGLVLAGCSQKTSTFSINGTVTEAGSAVGDSAETPLQGVTVSVGSISATTTRSGSFALDSVPAGAVSVTFALDGYETHTEALDLRKNEELTVALTPSGGRLTVAGDTLANLTALNGLETDDTKVNLSGNVADLTGAGTTAAGMRTSALSPLTTAITVEELQALVNGRVIVMDVAPDGSFDQEVPVDPGNNAIQLRVFDTGGNAYTSEPIDVFVTLDRLDMRVVLSWDQGGGTDVDLHLFKRNPNEVNPEGAEGSASWWTWDRHVFFGNKTPTDFGAGFENPFLDIDDTAGFGPETIVLQEATSGHYHVWVHLYRLPTAVDETTATVEVEINSSDDYPTVRSFTKTLTENKEYWYITTVDWASGSFIQVDPSN